MELIALLILGSVAWAALYKMNRKQERISRELHAVRIAHSKEKVAEIIRDLQRMNDN
jgi:hypothetical protein